MEIYHGGKFVKRHSYVSGTLEIWHKCDYDRWSHFEILDYVKEMGYDQIESMRCKGLGPLFEDLKLLSSDPQALEMVDIANMEGRA